jgi:hypothetical protein
MARPQEFDTTQVLHKAMGVFWDQGYKPGFPRWIGFWLTSCGFLVGNSEACTTRNGAL